MLIVLLLGPINFMLHSSQIDANSAFSDKNPNPGWIALHLVITAALIILLSFKYESFDLGFPTQIASSASWYA